MSLLFDEHRELDASIEVDPDVMRGRWRWPVGPALTASGLFLAVDFAFFAANLFKIREGGCDSTHAAVLVFTLAVLLSACGQGQQGPFGRFQC